MFLAGQEKIGKLIYVHYPRNRDKGKRPEMGIEKNRLGIGVADHAHTAVTAEILQLSLKLVPEIFIFKVVDPSSETQVAVIEDKPRPFCSKMGMIICPVENIINATSFGDRTVKTTHN